VYASRRLAQLWKITGRRRTRAAGQFSLRSEAVLLHWFLNVPARLSRIRHLLPLLALVLIGALIRPARAVLNNGSYVTTEPTTADVSNWTSGWNLGTGVTGWDYVGQVNGASGVYLGNGWVLTAGHVGPGGFTLNGASYAMISGTAHSFTTTNGSTTGTADLSLFQISNPPNLAALTLGSSTPGIFTAKTVMIGYGGGQGETWGYNTVTSNNDAISVSGFYSITFVTSYNSAPVWNQSHVVGGDSGGAAFINVNGHWQLAGILEALDNNNGSYMVQLSTYYSDITAITAVPEPAAASGLVALVVLIPLLTRLRADRCAARGRI
jgi:hypothetical protein